MIHANRICFSVKFIVFCNRHFDKRWLKKQVTKEKEKSVGIKSRRNVRAAFSVWACAKNACLKPFFRQALFIFE
ncbi:hypothetical protein AKG09_10280 [Neisseria sp. 83E34]|nr:hypothetical protein AKG09_10280 [Neisseria sp. 83E34]